MNLKRLSEMPSSPVLTPEQVLSLANSMLEKVHRTLIKEDQAQALASRLPAAVQWLESHYGVICQVGDFVATSTRPAKSSTVHVPAPIVMISSVKVDGEACTNYRRHHGRLHFHSADSKPHISPKAHEITVECMAGWQTGKLPHLVALSLVLICVHWHLNPEDQAKKEIGWAAHNVSQYMELFIGSRGKVVKPWP